MTKKVLITVIIAFLFPNSRLMHRSIFSYDFPKIRNLPKIFLNSFKNVGLVSVALVLCMCVVCV